MSLPRKLQTHIDSQGKLILPPEVALHYGLRPGAQVQIENGTNSLRLCRPVTHFAKVYIEPTNGCNLECRTCIRNIWDEPLGEMSSTTFERIIEGLRSFSPPPTIFFGGLGEPLAHPAIVEMVAQAKACGSSVELITNGTLLSKELSKQLISAGLDMLWVSLDGATPESYADVRLGATLPKVLANLNEFRDSCWMNRYSSFFVEQIVRPPIGIVFVAMKRNIKDLPSVLRLGNRLGVRRFMITNVLPYTPEMCEELLYARALNDAIYMSSSWGIYLEVPRMDINAMTREPLFQLMNGANPLSFPGADLGAGTDRCPFIEKGAVAIRWDGDVSPCLPLLHDHRTYLYGYERSLRRYRVGNAMERDLFDLWNLPEYLSFRERVQKFDFSPCTNCGGCDLTEKNEEDCFGNIFPACGACLWAQGIIQCP